MLAFLLTLVLSKVATLGGPVLLLIAAGVLFWRKWTHTAVVLAMVAGGWFASGLIYQEGVAACEVRVAVAVHDERIRQDAANAAANDFQRGLVAGLLQGQRDLSATIKDNDNEAGNDPNAAGCGLSLAGVRRYEKLRRRAH